MWDILEVTYEGTNDVKRVRKHALIQEYELFRMQKGESICDVQKRFSHIVNHLMSLGKKSDEEELNIKVLSLDRTWQPKVTAISESKDLTSMIVASLFDKLREYEIEIQRLAVQESEDKNNKSITLKASKQQHVSRESEEENISLLSRKFSKFLRKKQASKRYDSNKSSEFNSNKYTCYGCGDQGHIKSECPNNEVKENGDFKREKKGKVKKAYIAWDDNDISSSSSSDDEEVNLCLLASVTSSVDSTSTSKGITYDQLLNAFYETHDEANRLALSLNRLKGLNNWLENKVKDLEEELCKTNEDLEHLDLIYKNSSCNCEKISCENCEFLEKKICYLLITLDKLTTGKSNLEDVLASQKCVFGKVGLGFYLLRKEKKIAKPFSNFPEKQLVKVLFQPVVTCFYCMKKGHFVRYCRFRKSLVPKGIYKWSPRCIVNIKS